MDFNASMPIYLQVVDDIKKKIVLGKISPGEKMQSTRDLALSYKINPNTAVRIYKELENEQICEIRRGLGSYVTESDTVIKRLKIDMAERFIDAYISNMKELGFSYNEMKEFIEKRGNEK